MQYCIIHVFDCVITTPKCTQNDEHFDVSVVGNPNFSVLIMELHLHDNNLQLYYKYQYI